MFIPFPSPHPATPKNFRFLTDDDMIVEDIFTSLTFALRREFWELGY
jgi:hypothetical protein